MEYFIGMKRRIPKLKNYVYEITAITGLNPALPADPKESLVTLSFIGGRGVDDNGTPYVCMPLRVMLAETTAFRSPVPIDNVFTVFLLKITDDDGTKDDSDDEPG